VPNQLEQVTVCFNYDDPCDDCMGIPSDIEDQCFFCEKIDCICDELTDNYKENIDLDF